MITNTKYTVKLVNDVCHHPGDSRHHDTNTSDVVNQQNAVLHDTSLLSIAGNIV